jgi:hypothetical protein
MEPYQDDSLEWVEGFASEEEVKKWGEYYWGPHPNETTATNPSTYSDNSFGTPMDSNTRTISGQQSTGTSMSESYGPKPASDQDASVNLAFLNAGEPGLLEYLEQYSAWKNADDKRVRLTEALSNPEGREQIFQTHVISRYHGHVTGVARRGYCPLCWIEKGIGAPHNCEAHRKPMYISAEKRKPVKAGEA